MKIHSFYLYLTQLSIKLGWKYTYPTFPFLSNVLFYKLYNLMWIFLLLSAILCIYPFNDTIYYFGPTSTDNLSNTSGCINIGYDAPLESDNNIVNKCTSESRLDLDNNKLNNRNYNTGLQNQVTSIIKDKPDHSSSHTSFFNKLFAKIKSTLGIRSPEHKQVEKYIKRNLDLNKRRNGLQREVSKSLNRDKYLH